MNEDQMENRFGEYREKTNEELEIILEKKYEELESFESVFNTTSNSNEKADAWTDIKFLREEIAFIEKIQKERSNTR